MAMKDTENKLSLGFLPVMLLAAGICCFLWGSATPSIKTGYELFAIDSSDTASIIVFAGLRFFFAGLAVIVFHSLSGGGSVKPEKGSLPAILSIALVQTILQYFFFYVGLAHATGVNGSIISGADAICTILIAVFIFRCERMNSRKIVGCVIGFIGIVIVNLPGLGDSAGGGFSVLGEGFVLLSTICYGLSGNMIKKYSGRFDVVMLSGWQFVIGAAVLIAAGLAMGGRIGAPVSPAGYLLLIYLMFISAVAYTLWGMLLKYNPVSRVAICACMTPVFGVILSALFLGEAAEAFSPGTLAALLLVCAGIFIVNHED